MIGRRSSKGSQPARLTITLIQEFAFVELLGESSAHCAPGAAGPGKSNI